MRVIAGSAKGHHLKPPASQATRPTADKIKGALFAMLESLCGLEDMRVLDLYAGTGALAIEALSRGAAWADLVEQHKPTCAIIRQNLEHTRCADRAAIHPISVRASFAAPYFTDGLPYDIILLDPPYADPTISQVMETLAASNMVGETTVVVLEHARRFAVQPSYGRLRLLKIRYHGDTGLSIYTAAGDSGIASEDDVSPERATGSEGNGLEDSDLPG